MRQRRGFTLMEMMAVVVTVGILATMSVPAFLPALRKAKVQESAGYIENVARQARILAMSRNRPIGASASHYGVVLVPNSGSTPAYAALTYGTTATTGDILMNGSEPAVRYFLNRNVALWRYAGTSPGGSRNAPAQVDAGALASEVSSGTIGWIFDYRTGHPLNPDSVTDGPIGIGCGHDPLAKPIGSSTSTTRYQWPSPIADHLSVRSLDGRHRVAIAIYGFGEIATGWMP